MEFYIFINKVSNINNRFHFGCVNDQKSVKTSKFHAAINTLNDCFTALHIYQSYFQV